MINWKTCFLTPCKIPRNIYRKAQQIADTIVLGLTLEHSNRIECLKSDVIYRKNAVSC